MATRVQITFDCADPDRLARFWAEALEYRFPPPPDGHATWEDWLRSMGIPEVDWNRASALEDPDGVGPRIYFQRVPEPKTVKNRVHLDVDAGGGRHVPHDERLARVRAAADRMESIGATKVEEMEEMGGFHIVMLDPEGNEFCLQ